MRSERVPRTSLRKNGETLFFNDYGTKAWFSGSEEGQIHRKIVENSIPKRRSTKNGKKCRPEVPKSAKRAPQGVQKGLRGRRNLIGNAQPKSRRGGDPQTGTL